MTQSMTGFARGSVTTPQFAVIVELRSVNNRFLDLHFRCPENLRGQEPVWRKAVGRRFDRGKVEINIRLQSDPASESLVINGHRLNAIGDALAEIARKFPEARAPSQLALLQSPGVIASEELDESAVAEAVNQALNSTLDDLLEQRESEGAKLATMVRDRAAGIAALLSSLKDHLPQLRAGQRQRILDRLAQAGVEPDARRLEEELVYVAQRSDVDEEMDRLGAHLEAIVSALDSGKPCGRRLDFLMQELNREANTLSSKATSLTSTNTAVEFKVLIEQMREQVQNIE